MKSISIRDLQKQLKAYVDASQSDRVVVTRHGRPAAVLVGVEGMDWESVVLQTNAAFWEMIEQRRKEPTISLEEMRQRVLGKPNGTSKRVVDPPANLRETAPRRKRRSAQVPHQGGE